MATGQLSGGYGIGAQTKSIKTPFYDSPNKRLVKKKTMKQTLKSRLRNWLMDTDEAETNSMYVEQDKLSSDGIRLQIYKASGGFVVETRSYDRKTDRNNNSMHVITDEQDLGDALGKIVMMEALR